MAVETDVRALSTNQLEEHARVLDRHRRVADGTYGGKDRTGRKERQRLAEELGEFTPEKAAALELARGILAFRTRAGELMTLAKQEPAAPSAPRLEEVVFASNDVVQTTWQRGFQLLADRNEAFGAYPQGSAPIWHGITEMLRNVRWIPWTQNLGAMRQDEANLPIIFFISPDDTSFGRGRYGVSSRMLINGLNGHGAQRHGVTEEWAGLMLCKALAQHLATLQRNDDFRRFTTLEQFNSPAFTDLSKKASADGNLVYMHGVNHLTGGGFFRELVTIVRENRFVNVQQLSTITPVALATFTRRIDAVVARPNAPTAPLSKEEAEERVHMCAQGIAFQIHAQQRGRYPTAIGSYDRPQLNRPLENAAIQELRLMYQREAGRQPSGPLPVQEQAVDTWAAARHVNNTVHNNARPGAVYSGEKPSIRRDAENRTVLAQRIFEAMLAVERWRTALVAPEFAATYARANSAQIAAGDLEAVRTHIADLVKELRDQALHDGRLEGMDHTALQELYLFAFETVRRVAQTLGFAGGTATHPGDDLQFAVLTLYTLLREAGNGTVRGAANELFYYVMTSTAERRVSVGEPAVPPMYPRYGLDEKAHIAHAGSALRDFLAASPRETLAARLTLQHRTVPFAYVMERPAPQHPKLLVACAIERGYRSAIASVIGATGLPKGTREGPSQDIIPGGVGVVREDGGTVYGTPVLGGGFAPRQRLLVPETADPRHANDLLVIRDALPLALARKRREIGIIAPGVPEDVIAQTVFWEHKGALYARCPTRELALRYGEALTIDIEPRVDGWFTVRLPTIAELEHAHFQGARVDGRFFQEDAAEGPDGPSDEPRKEQQEGEDGQDAPEEAPESHRRLHAVADVLLRLRENAAYTWDAGGEVNDEQTTFNYREAKDGHWVIIDVPSRQRQIFVCDNPERTYVYPGVRPVEQYATDGKLSPRKLQASGAKQIFWNTQDQFENSLTQALVAPKWDEVSTGSVDALLAAHGARVRERIAALVTHVNEQPGRTVPVTMETLRFSALRAGVKSGRAEGEPHCGDTIVAGLARMAGMQNPIPYKDLRAFFDELMDKLNAAPATEAQ